VCARGSNRALLRGPSTHPLEVMPNSADTAARWTRYLVSRAYVPRAPLIQQHFDSGKIKRLCDCGCQSFDLAIEADVPLEPLMPPSERGGCALALSYHVLGRSELGDFVDFRIFVDARGYLSGVDVDFRANSAPMPEQVVLVEPPFHLSGALLGMTSNNRWRGP
jgi:hypothetical protein